METETSSDEGGFVSDKVTQVESDDGALGFKLQRTESYPYKAVMKTHHHHHHHCAVQPFKSIGGGMAESASYPFTEAQWQELERQALIFKHMMASIPVPSDLLLPIARNLSDAGGRGSGSLNLRFSNSTDPEPGRCRRTDGKKWRCSRDVAPDQKYCERHMHRGRPRSRKHVELQAQITTNDNNNNSSSASAILVKPDFTVPSFEAMASSQYKEPREGMDLQHLVQMKLSSASTTANSVFQYQQEDLNLNSYTDFSHENHHQQSSDHGYLFHNNELASLEEDPQRPRQFIDAWSTTTRDNNSTEANNKSSSIPANGKLTLSNLTLSMSGCGNGGDETQMVLGLNKSLPLSWMNPVPSMASPPGGPLGEVLQSSTTARGPPDTSRSTTSGGNVGLNLMTDNWIGGGEAPSKSSPSSMLQRTLASLSDSSGSSSPTFKRGDSMYL